MTRRLIPTHPEGPEHVSRVMFRERRGITPYRRMPVKEFMQYPQDFPPESRSRVAAERLRAGKDFDHAREKPLPREYGAKRDLEAELRRYILRQFAVFVSEAGKLGRQGIWPVDRVEQACLEFLRLATIEARYSKGFDKSGRAFAQGWIGSWGDIEPRVMREFERSGEWRQFQEVLLQVAGCRDAGRQEGTAEMTRGSVRPDISGNALTQVEDAAVPAPELPAPAAAQQVSRRAAVDAFLFECNKSAELPLGSKAVKKHIWRAVGHTHPRQFQYWQSESEETTEEDERNFGRILSMPPGEFLAFLKKMGIL